MVLKLLAVSPSLIVGRDRDIAVVRTVLALVVAPVSVLAIAAFVFTSPGAVIGAEAIPKPATGAPDCGEPGALSTPVPLAASPTAAASEPALKPVEDIPLPGSASRFDYQSLDPSSGRLYIAHMGAGKLVVFDTASRKVVGTVDDLPTVTGVLAVPELHRVYAAVAGDHQVAVIDDQTLQVVARLGEIGFPDGLDYVPQTRNVFISDESGGGELVLDASKDKVVTTIDLGGEAGNTHYDEGSGCVFVAVQTRSELVAIDPVNLKIVERIDLGGDCKGPHGFLIDAPSRHAFVTCEGSAKLLVVDLATAQVIGTQDVGDGPDVLAFDPGLHLLYVASESGVVSIFEEHGSELRSVGEYVAPHAHTVAVDPATHLVYLPLESVDGKPVLRIMKSGE